MQIFIRTIEGHTQLLAVNPSDNVLEVRQHSLCKTFEFNDTVEVCNCVEDQYEDVNLSVEDYNALISSKLKPNARQFLADAVSDTRLVLNSRYLDDGCSLKECGVFPDSTLQMTARLCGGAHIAIKVKTNFGCGCCCNLMFCEACGGGRVYDININTIADVESIFAAIAQQNKRITDLSKPIGMIMTSKNVVMEPGKKILVYDVKENDVLVLQLNPTYWFKKEFKKSGADKKREEEEEDEEFEAQLAKKKAEKASKEAEKEAKASLEE